MVSNVAAANLINHVKENSDREEKDKLRRQNTEYRIQNTEYRIQETE